MIGDIPWWLVFSIVIGAWLTGLALFTHAVKEFSPLHEEPKGRPGG